MLSWIRNFSDKEIHAPFSVKTDNDYIIDLRKRFSHFCDLLHRASADEESIEIAEYYTNMVCKALDSYYKGKITSYHSIIKSLVQCCEDDELALSYLNHSRAFQGDHGSEIQFFRARLNHEITIFPPQEMVHIPFDKRSKSGNYRFSIPGVISSYLANSSYGCWIELGRPPEQEFNVSPIVLDDEQKIFNLAVMSRDCSQLDDGDEKRVHCWIKLLILMIATSYRVDEKDRTFKSEYIISQSIMLACKELNYDGVAYYSKRVDNELFSLAAINLALFAEYQPDQKYGSICQHLKVDESLNFQFFKQLSQSVTFKEYPLRVVRTPLITNIGSFHRQYSYRETAFYFFDRYLFSRWDDKDTIEWGNFF